MDEGDRGVPCGVQIGEGGAACRVEGGAACRVEGGAACRVEGGAACRVEGWAVYGEGGPPCGVDAVQIQVHKGTSLMRPPPPAEP